MSEPENDEDLVILKIEIERLKNIEAFRDILQGEVNELKVALNDMRMEVSSLKDALDGMSTDMGLMEDTIRELSGIEPGGEDFGP